MGETLGTREMMQRLGADTWIGDQREFIAISTTHQQIFAKAPTFGGPHQYDYEQVLSTDLEESRASRSTSTGGMSITKAIVGGVIAGPAGMVIGGVTGSRKTSVEEWTSELALVLTVQGNRQVAVLRIVLYKSPHAPGHAGTLKTIREAALTLVATLRHAPHFAAARNVEQEAARIEAMDISSRAEMILLEAGWRVRRAERPHQQYFDILLAVKGERKVALAAIDYANEYDVTKQIAPCLDALTTATERAVVCNQTSADHLAARRGIRVLSLRDLETFSPAGQDAFDF